jgi:hypothetical protein
VWYLLSRRACGETRLADSTLWPTLSLNFGNRPPLSPRQCAPTPATLKGVERLVAGTQC